MNLADLWAEIESEHQWRSDELRFFRNQISQLESESERQVFRKALVLLLYAHFEGFCKFAFAHYIKAVNSEGLACGDVNFALATASLFGLFKELRNPKSKAVEFKNKLPEDAKLHQFARDREFLEGAHEYQKKGVAIPDEVVDTESNLKPLVLRKNLYRIGFPHDKFHSLEGQIDKLLNYRNKIAHGVIVAGIERKVYEELENDVKMIIFQIKSDIMNALSTKAYLRS